MFDSRGGRTCLHYAAYYGHSSCLQAILSAASTSPVAASWGYSRFVSIRDRKGATPLHLAARQRHPECVHILLDNGALVSASTGGYGFAGSNPLHFAARGGSLDCIRELLAWGADRIQRDASGRGDGSPKEQVEQIGKDVGKIMYDCTFISFIAIVILLHEEQRVMKPLKYMDSQFLLENRYASFQVTCIEIVNWVYEYIYLTVASRVAEEMSVKLGEEVGYTIRFEDITNNPLPHKLVPRKKRAKH